MVLVHELSAALVVKLGLELLSFQARRRTELIQQGSSGTQLPRTHESEHNVLETLHSTGNYLVINNLIIFKYTY